MVIGESCDEARYCVTISRIWSLIALMVIGESCDEARYGVTMSSRVYMHGRSQP